MQDVYDEPCKCQGFTLGFTYHPEITGEIMFAIICLMAAVVFGFFAGAAFDSDDLDLALLSGVLSFAMFLFYLFSINS